MHEARLRHIRIKAKGATIIDDEAHRLSGVKGDVK